MNYPEHEKLKAISSESQAQGALLEWLQGDGITLSRYSEDGYASELRPDGESIMSILARFHEIDTGVLEAEKRQMLEEMREAAQGSGS